jgi:hypothetical protein
VIDNSGSEAELSEKVERLVSRLRQES